MNEIVIEPTTEAFYRSFTVETLKLFRVGFAIDRENAADRAFCDARLALIDRILAEREANGVKP